MQHGYFLNETLIAESPHSRPIGEQGQLPYTIGGSVSRAYTR